MAANAIYCLQIFFLVLDCIVLLYLLRSLLLRFPFGKQLLQLVITLLLPIWVPMQYLLRHSILHTMRFDLSPYILLLLLTYLQRLCSLLLNG